MIDYAAEIKEQLDTAEVLAAGYSSVDIVDFETGGPWPGGASAFAVIARP